MRVGRKLEDGALAAEGFIHVAPLSGRNEALRPNTMGRKSPQYPLFPASAPQQTKTLQASLGESFHARVFLAALLRAAHLSRVFTVGRSSRSS